MKCMNTLIVVVSCLRFTGLALAHDPGLSTLVLTLDKDRLDAVLTLSSVDAEALGSVSGKRMGRTPAKTVAAPLPQLEEITEEGLEVRSAASVEEPSQVVAERIRESSSDNLQIRLAFPMKAQSRVSLRSRLIHDLPAGHRQYVSLLDRMDFM